ncbi:MAG: DUF401 family protein, partial [bacterium]|nr:DUF401 family protein [bacterium]
MILLLKIVSIVAALVLFLRYKLNISLSIFLLTLYMVVIFGVNARAALSAGAGILVSEPTLRLIVIIVMVLFIAAVLKAWKLFDKLIASLNSIIRDSRIVALIAPALIGFLPMPGGALVSAPLVDVSTNKMNLKPEFNTFLNFWFRHVWEFVWPV